MITRFITNVTIKFNPFHKSGKTCRVFLANLPANARQTMKINTQVLSRDSKQSGTLTLTFKDGMELQLDPQKIGIKDIMEEVDRHSRKLDRQADLAGN